MKTKRLTTATILACVLASTFLSRAQPCSLDPTFNPGTGANGAILCMALQTNGQIIIGGSFTTFNGSPHIHLARLNTDGGVDGTFDAGGPDNQVEAIVVQADGKILIGGPFSSVNGVANLAHVARLRSDGSVDTSFNPDPGVAGYPRGSVHAVAAQQDGKVWAGGNFYYVSGTNRNNVVRFNQNGTLDLDLSLTPDVSIFNVCALGVQSDGKVILGLHYASALVSYLERLNTDGSVDTNFLAVVAGSISSEAVYSIVVLPDDRLLIGGDFSSVNGYSRNGVARINADGSVDTTFHPGTGANYTVWCVAVQADGKVLVGGSFWTFNGVTRNGIVRLNADGSVDSGFNPGGGVHTLNNYPNPPIMCVAGQPDGKTLIGGQFTQFNGTNINYIARLNGDNSSTTNLQFMSSQLYFGMNLSGVVSNTYRLEYTSELNTPSLWTPLFNVTLQTNPQFILDPNPAGGQRFYRAVQLSP